MTKRTKIMVVAGLLLIFVGVVTFGLIGFQPKPSSQAKVNQPVPTPVSGATVAPITAPSSMLDTFATPFAALPGAGGSATGGLVPQIPNMPVPSMPQVPNMSFPKPPLNGSGNVSISKQVITVKAISMSDSGDNMAILANGNDQMVVREGQSSKWGYVSLIEPDGVVLDGQKISYAFVLEHVDPANTQTNPTFIPATVPVPSSIPAPVIR